jgi:hypothetical protein
MCVEEVYCLQCSACTWSQFYLRLHRLFKIVRRLSLQFPVYAVFVLCLPQFDCLKRSYHLQVKSFRDQSSLEALELFAYFESSTM